MKLKALIFFINGLFLSGCGYELPKTPKTAVNSTNSQTNENAKNQSNEIKDLVNAEKAGKSGAAISKEENVGDGTKLILSGTGESATYPCNGREVEVEESTTASRYTLTGECKKLVVDGVSNEINIEKVGEIAVSGTSNKVIYSEGLNGKKPKITKSGTSTSVESKKSLEEKKKSEIK